MAAEICIQSFAYDGKGSVTAGDQMDSTSSVVTQYPAFFELVTAAATNIATVSFAYGAGAGLMVNRGDSLPNGHPAVTLAPGYFTASGTSAAQAARAERLGTHR